MPPSVSEPEGGREAAVAEYFRWNTDGRVQSVTVLATASVLLTFAMIDLIADFGLGYNSLMTHRVLVATAVVCAAPIGFRQRHTMQALRLIEGIIALACILVPVIGWRLIPPASGVTAHLPGVVIIPAVAAFIPAICVLASTTDEHWHRFVTYCRLKTTF